MNVLSVFNKPVFESNSEKRLYNYTFYSLVLGLIYPVVNDGSAFTNFVSLACTGFAILAIFTYFSSYSVHKSSFSLKLYMIAVLYMLVIGILGGSLQVDKPTLMLTITQDIRYVSLFLLGGIFAQDERLMDMFHQLLQAVAVIAVIMALISVILIVQGGTLIARGGEDSTSYHYWWAATTCFAYCGFNSFFSQENKKINLGVLILYFLVGMSFLKRSCFINSVIVVILSFYLLSKQGKGKKIFSNLILLLFVAFIITIILPGASDKVFGLLFERFSDTASDMNGFDRLMEYESYKYITTLSQQLKGFGIGNYIYYDRYGNNSEVSLLNALHLGYANIMYKGGIVYALFYIFTYLQIFLNWFRRKQNASRYLVCFGVSISALISLFYEGSWTYTILPFCISAPIFYAARIKGGK